MSGLILTLILIQPPRVGFLDLGVTRYLVTLVCCYICMNSMLFIKWYVLSELWNLPLVTVKTSSPFFSSSVAGSSSHC